MTEFTKLPVPVEMLSFELPDVEDVVDTVHEVADGVPDVTAVPENEPPVTFVYE